MFSSGWRYYAEIILKEDAPAGKRPIGTSTMGIDPGVSTVAGVSETACVLEELAPKAIRYEKKNSGAFPKYGPLQTNQQPE